MICKAIGIDLGDARIGIAVSDDLAMLAHPRETLAVKSCPDPAAHIAKLAEAEKATVIVLGMPKNMDGTSGPAAEKSRLFAEKVRQKTSCPVLLWDERLTTVAAQRALRESGRNVRQSRPVIDQVAAQILLQSYLDSLPSGI